MEIPILASIFFSSVRFEAKLVEIGGGDGAVAAPNGGVYAKGTGCGSEDCGVKGAVFSRVLLMGLLFFPRNRTRMLWRKKQLRI